MAKRFTDTEKWNKRFIRGLKPAYKLLWLYITDSCNHAGIWDVDIEVAKLKLGLTVSETEALKVFKEKIISIDGGSKWFIPSFIEFQYGELSEVNRAHTKVIFLLKKYNLLNTFLKPLAMPLISPLQGAKEQEQYKEEEKEEEATVKITPLIVIPNPHAPTKETVYEVFVRNGSNNLEAEKFYNYYNSINWKIGQSFITNFSSLVPKWLQNARNFKTPELIATKTPEEILAERKKQ